MKLERATDGVHKYVAVFADGTRVPFGAKGMSDYTIHKDPARRNLYLTRHRAREKWNNPKTAGALSRWILWGDSTSLQTNLRNFKQRFSLP
jgi:hypothetical protein